jgi:HAE1 family hydrophobic/amphiphilic exporter-1
VLAIGIVVDDAIVVVEAVQVNMANGMDPKEATNKAIREVKAPVIATTLVLVAVFLPTVGIAGITGRLYQQFAITVTISVCFSSVNALTLSPALCSLILRKPKPYGGILGRFFTGFEKVFKRSSGSYMSLTNVLTRKMKRGVVFIGIAVAAMIVLGGVLPSGFMPDEDQGYLFINLQLPDAASLQRSDAVMNRVEKILDRYEEFEYYTAATGFSLLSGSMTPNSGFVAVSLREWSERDRTATDMIRVLNADFSKEVREGQVFAFGPPPIPGLGSGSGFTVMVQDRGGNTPEYLAEQTTGFIRELMQRPEVGSAFTTFRAGVPQRYLDIDRDKVLQSGVALNSIYTTIGAFLGGTYVNDFNRFGRLYRTYIQAEPEFRQDPDKMNLFFVRNAQGDSAPLSAFVNVNEISGPDYINRFNLFRAIEVKGAPAQGYSSAQAMAAIEETAALTLPSDMGFEWTDMSYQEKKASGTGAIVFVFSLVFVFLILAAQYESWSLPWSILLGTPFAVLGAFLALFVARLFSESYLSNVFAQISLVMLIAMAAKNAILIVEFAKLEFDGGLSLFDAAIKSAELRFRPILMTAFSFILGILPLIFAAGSGAEARKVMGMALLGGMTLATILGVFFYPMLFVLIGRIAGYEKGRDAVKGEVKEA